MSIIQDFIAAAKKDIGTVESPKGSNRGVRVEQMLRNTGIGGGNPWCAAAVATWGKETAKAGGWSWPVPLSASCDVILFWARKNGYLHTTPKAGDIFLVMAHENDATHTGIVTAVENGLIRTIEGNSNSGGSREGYAVVLRSRSLSSKLRYIRWVDAVDDAPDSGHTEGAQAWTLNLEGVGPLGQLWMVSGTGYYPARALLSRPELMGAAETTSNLTFDADDNALLWGGQPIPAPVALKDGSAYAGVRALALWLKRAVDVDSEKRTVTLRKD